MLIQRFEWDVEKSEANVRLRGLDFGFGSLVFEGVTVELEDGRRDYGERRIIAFGVVDGIQLTVVYTDREVTPGQIVRRIISVWRSNRRERTIYKKAAGADTPAAGVGGSRVAP
jgi:uncharacterized DUF497 family protein